MSGVGGIVDRAARESGFSGVVRAEREGSLLVQAQYGWADRRHGIPMLADT